MEALAERSAESIDAGAIPSGTVSFLFTDIEGSTQRWDRDPAAMQDAVRRHDALMREAIAAHDGHVFKTIGDAFCASFWTAGDAVLGALRAQRALAEQDFSAVNGVRVRMAIHSGNTDERDGDYFGPPVNRVARLLSIGHGGQVLVSGITADLARPLLPIDVTLRDMGQHRLKDLTAPEHVFQLRAADLAADFPKLRSLNIGENNLPQQVTTFFGREHDVAEIKALVGQSRLVTLFAAGGVGKTRCSLQVGADLLEEFNDGVWFADLAPLVDAALVPNQIASIFDLQESVNRPILETLVSHCKAKHLLLILDNCEHVIDDASRTAAALLRSCPKLNIIATSREALKVAGEVVYRMPSLAVPSASTELTAEAALGYGAVALFESRARAANGKFVLTDENASSVAEICLRLDGIPLAIELAAARVKVLAPRQLAQKLDERFRILTGGDRTALPRQQTMRALIDWSYDLLSDVEKKLWRFLSAFAGSFSIETAIAVCASDEMEDFEVLDHISSLVDKSIVLTEPDDHDTRYRLLESMRQYAREKALECNEFEQVASLHAVAFKELAEQLERDYEHIPYRTWLARADAELENVRAALTWSFGSAGDMLTGQRLAATLSRVLVAFAAAEARRWVSTARAMVTDETPRIVVARLDLAEAHLATVLNQYQVSLAAAERALSLFEAEHDARGVADAQRWAGRSLVYMGRLAEGEALLNKSLVTHRTLGSRRVGSTLRDLAVARGSDGDVVGARALFAQALATFKDGADEGNVAITAGTLAEAEFRCGEPLAALRSAEEGLEAARALNRQRMEAWLLNNIAAFFVALGHHDRARANARDALRVARELKAEIYAAFAFQHLAASAALDARIDAERDAEELACAARLTGFVDGRLAALEVAREFTELQEYEKMTAALAKLLGADLTAKLMAESRDWKEERALIESARAVELAAVRTQGGGGQAEAEVVELRLGPVAQR